jgi:hypothetical protein
MTALLGGIAAISLIVGGIGIMDIMLADRYVGIHDRSGGCRGGRGWNLLWVLSGAACVTPRSD